MPGRAVGAALVVAAASLAGVTAGAWSMADRVSAFNRLSTRELFIFQPVDLRTFEFAGREVSVTDTDDGHGNAGVLVRYGDAELPLRATIPSGSASLPGLARHADWLTLWRFAPRRGVSFDELQRRIAAGQVADRLVVVVREPQPGSTPGTFADIGRSDWTFQFHELLPGGGFANERFRIPESDRAFRGRQSEAVDHHRPPPQRREDELKSGTWEFEAALLAMPAGWVTSPGGGEAPPTFAGDAMHAMGWTLPVTSVSFMALIGAGIALVIVRPGAAPQRP